MLTLAVRRRSDPKVIDFLAKSLSPAENDAIKGCVLILLAFYRLLIGLSDGISTIFLLREMRSNCLNTSSTSYREMQTRHYWCSSLKIICRRYVCYATDSRLSFLPSSHQPLHLAVTSGSIAIVQKILGYSTASVLLRDIDGSTSLHTAVRSQFPKIFKALAAVVDGEALQMEDSVGHTILEVVSMPELEDRTKAFLRTVPSSPSELDPSSITHNYRHPYDKEAIKRLEKELPYLHGVIDILIPEERKKRRTKVIWELNTFATMVDTRMKKAKALLEAEPAYKREDAEKQANMLDWADARETLVAVREALASRPAKRQLVHVADVQKSVASDLKAAKQANDHSGGGGTRHDDLEEEKEIKVEQELKESMIGEYVDLEGGSSSEDDDSDY